MLLIINKRFLLLFFGITIITTISLWLYIIEESNQTVSKPTIIQDFPIQVELLSDDISMLGKERLQNHQAKNDGKPVIVNADQLLKISDDPITNGQILVPEPIQDSSYANDQSTNDRVENEQVVKIIEEIKKEEALRSDINPANPKKNWKIKINPRLKTLTSMNDIKDTKILKDFFSKILRLMHGNRLSFPLKQRMEMVNGKTVIDPVMFYSKIDDELSENKLKTLFYFPENFLADAKIKHKIVTDNLPDIDPSFYSGSGYVIVGGGKYSWFALLVIETLRKLGSTLPIEVIIPTVQDYEASFCERVLPNYNAKCVNIHDLFDPVLLEKIKVTGYQYKSLALLASSFENAFLLDADNYPVSNPDLLFESQLYNDYTMITWPDYWRRTTSPYFYNIRGTTIGKRVRFLNDLTTEPESYITEDETDDDFLLNKVSYHDREGTLPEWTTESGEMLINKKVHFKALLLALYYNLEGQFGFYPLLSQGGAGEGDKETFVAASHYFGLKYYQVNKKPDRAYGFYKNREDDDYVDTSIIQYNPLRDFEILKSVNENIETRLSEAKSKNEKFKYKYKTMFFTKFSGVKSEPMFYHVHETKMDPINLIDIQATFDLNGKKIRNLGGDFPRFGFDLELFLWEKINQHWCIEKTNLKFIQKQNEKDIKNVCGLFMNEQLQFLKKSQEIIEKNYDPRRPLGNLSKCCGLLDL